MSLFEFYRMGIPMLVPSLELLVKWHLEDGVLSERTWDRVFGHPSSHSQIPHHPSLNTSFMFPSEDERDRFYDPNDEFSEDSLTFWLKYSDFYTWPYITTFESWGHLFEILDELLFDGSIDRVTNNMGRRVSRDSLLKGDANLRKDVSTDLYESNGVFMHEHGETPIRSLNDKKVSTGTRKLLAISKKMMVYNRNEEEAIKNKWINILEGLYNTKTERLKLKLYEDILPEDINQGLARDYGYTLTLGCDGQIIV